MVRKTLTEKNKKEYARRGTNRHQTQNREGWYNHPSLRLILAVMGGPRPEGTKYLT